MSSVFFFLAGVFVILLAQYITKPSRKLEHEYEEGVTRIVVQDFHHEEVARTTVYGTSEFDKFKCSWVGKHLCYSPVPAYFQESHDEVGSPKTK